MKFFIDTANVNEIKEALAMGILDGVTTNPSLAAREFRADRKDRAVDQQWPRPLLVPTSPPAGAASSFSGD